MFKFILGLIVGVLFSRPIKKFAIFVYEKIKVYLTSKK